ncbi:putative membrane protein [Pseudonocardia thermophila]|jgi:Predicted membrane protein|uniref:Putative membrane protein n=1 Tax=Pseudonocardia thermophila TaxID=1848 RepID=A0A1M6X9Q9_PSETH|nr:phage holin family protein [Pseudonocardia thermophila]SHL02742.1 putative membrane protein [Pseudonocardia thermophila]
MRVVPFIVHVLVVAVALWVCTILPIGVESGGSTTGARIGTLVVVALIFGLVNAVIKPIVKVVGCAFYVLTLGLIALVVNALLFMLVGWIAGKIGLDFTIDGFWSAFWGAIVIAVVSWLLHVLIPDRIDER